ncbi:hypothetical protein C2857_006750 [Epichloe festucae Fl1]|uniref:C2H2-type domain-containing protein n=1 Tax=Epichloe festucae (strain Fl1) TaxID=877507 RepID=A0A7S9KTQ7_EPIFF|nr:hypothetical protein C2857_006750 [Epichloe festucae Fl1]
MASRGKSKALGELSPDEMRTLGAMDSSVNLSAGSPTVLRASALALISERTKRHRAEHSFLSSTTVHRRTRLQSKGRSSAGFTTIHRRTRLESIDESSEDTTDVATVQARHQPSMQVKCPCCDEVFPRQMDLDHHVRGSHTGPRPDVPRVICPGFDPADADEDLMRLTGGVSPAEYFTPSRLSNPAQNESWSEGWRTPALLAIGGVPGEPTTPPKSSNEPSLLPAKPSEHHEPSLGPSIPRSQAGLSARLPKPPQDKAVDHTQGEEKVDGDDEEVYDDDDDDDDDYEDDEDVYGQYNEYLSTSVVGFVKDGNESQLPRRLPRRAPRRFSPTAGLSREKRQLPSIDSIISDTATVTLGTAASVKPAVVRRPSIDDGDESNLSFNSSDTSTFSADDIPAQCKSEWTRLWKRETLKVPGVWLCHCCEDRLVVDSVRQDENMHEVCKTLQIQLRLERVEAKGILQRRCASCARHAFCKLFKFSKVEQVAGAERDRTLKREDACIK